MVNFRVIIIHHYSVMHYLFTLLLSLFVSVSFAQINDSVVVYFETNNATISANENRKIIAAFSQYKTHTPKLLIYGYTDKMGDNKANIHLAEQRAATLAKEVKAIIPNANIRLVEGIGEDVKASGTHPDQRGRRAVVYIIGDKLPKPLAPAPIVAQLQNTPLDQKQVNVYGAIDLPNIIFHPNSIFLLQESLPALNALIKTLKSHPELKFELQGHVCCNFELDELSQAISYQLSIDRAHTIYKMFIKVGIAKERMTYKGYGTTMPIYKGEHIDSMDVNRRVSIKILN